MSNERRENEIDEIFRKAIEPVETEPSEEFWHKAAEDVIARGNTGAGKSTSRWKIIAFILAAGLLVLGYFAYTWENGLKQIEKQIANVENTTHQNTNSPIQLQKSSGTPQKTNSGLAYAKNLAINEKITHRGNSKKPYTKNVAYQKGSSQHNAIGYGKRHNPIVTSEKALPYIPNQYIAPVKDAPTAAMENGTIAANQEKPTGTVSNEKATPNNVSPIESKTPPTYSAQVNTQKNIDTTNSVTQTEKNNLKITQTIATASTDTTKVIPNLNAHAGYSRFSISAFFSPDFLVSYKFKSMEPSGIQCENSIQSEESQRFSYTAGAKGEFKISNRFSILAGIAYQVYSFNIKPCTLYAQNKSGGDLGYYITTSSGVVECPSYATTYPGDSIKMSASSSRSYLEFPLQIKYNFLAHEKYNVYCNVGMEVNLYLGEKTVMDWQDTWNESGVAFVNGAQGIKSIYLSYYIGAGYEYKPTSAISIYIEPGLHEAVTPLDDNTSTITYPRLFSITGGLTYHLN